MRRMLGVVGLLTLVLWAPGVAAGPAATFKSGVFNPPRMAPDFELQGSNGLPLKLSALRGKVVILEFGFTTCEEICPVTLAQLTAAYKALGPAAAGVQQVFVTVDPARDTPARLRDYLKTYNPTFLGATGTQKQMNAVNDAYGVLTKTVPVANPKVAYQVHHSSSLYLIDREGKLRLLAPFGKPVADLVHDIRLLLAEPSGTGRTGAQ